MELATTLTLVQTILTALQTLNDFKALFSFSNFKREFADLQISVNTIKSVLEDAGAMEDMLNSQDTIYIEQLKDAFYDADDVLDEFVTLVKRKKAIEASHEVIDKVRSFLYCFKPLIHNLSHKVKEVNKKLAVIAENNSKYRSTITLKPRKFIKPETSSSVYQNDPIIGRDEDLEKIVEMLLNPDDNVSSLAIVGMGGLGKTAFAQLVYNDPRITSAFPLKSWTCIADQDGWDLTQLLGKIVKELPGDDKHDLTSLQQIQTEIGKQLDGQKYLLVLDDVWTENYADWIQLVNPLMVGESGSRIVVTTRSKKTAEIIGDARVHELQGLSEDESWLLFERMAFRTEQRANLDEDFVKIGKDIVKKCFNVPLAIRVVGSLLNCESKSMWLLFRDKELADFSERDDTMNKILSLSYHQLDSSLKSCFMYCAIFPKDYEIDKQMLISLWMAQGYINAEYMGEEYFHILLRRCFFQDVTENIAGEIAWFKIHDLLHDIAEQAAGKEVCRLISDPVNVDREVHHLSLLNNFCPQRTFNKTHVRTCLHAKKKWWSPCRLDQLLANYILPNWSSLRSLDLSCLSAKRLPESIGKLFHLRYLNLSQSLNLKQLPESITKLVNLQTLDLSRCYSLEELPKDVWKLVDLSTLNISGCRELSYMPLKLGMLTKLHTLGLFVVGGETPYLKECFDGLEVLLDLKNLKGELEIHINVGRNAKYVKEEHGGGAYLMSKVHLHTISIEFSSGDDEMVEWQEALLEEMQPHANIRDLSLYIYSGETMPRWPSRENNSTLFFLPNLVNLRICHCKQLRFLPSLEKLPHLKLLQLFDLSNVEYVVNNNLEALSLGEGTIFFPCLDYLNIECLPKLKGWWPGSGEQNEQLIGKPFSIFAQLKKLHIRYCSMLKSIPICSRLNMVEVKDSDLDMSIDDMDQLTPNYKCLLPSESESKSRMIALSYFETFLPNKFTLE